MLILMHAYDVVKGKLYICSKHLLGWLRNEKILSMAYTKLDLSKNSAQSLNTSKQRTGKLTSRMS